MVKRGGEGCVKGISPSLVFSGEKMDLGFSSN